MPIDPLLDPLSIQRIGKDEKNFVENTIALLSERIDPNMKTLQFSRLLEGKEGKVTESERTLTGCVDYGLPIAGDEDVYLLLSYA